MRYGSLTLALCAGVALFTFASAQTQKAEPQDEQAQIQRHIQNLASPRYAVREKARVALEKTGAPALDALKKAVQSDDMDVSETARKLVAKLQQSQLTNRLLQPTQFELNLQNVSVADAIKQLERKSGISIQMQGSQKEIAGKKITLNLGKTTFWQAFDRICQEGGLVETSLPVRNTRRGDIEELILPGFVPPQVQPILPVQPRIQPANPNANNIKKIQNRLKKLRANKKLDAKEIRKELDKIRQELQRPAIKPAPRAPVAPRGALQVQVRRAVAQAQAPRPVPVQFPVQIQQPAFAPVQIINGRIVTPNNGNQNTTNKIVVRPGAPAKLPTFYAGALRLQIVSKGKDKNGPILTLRVSAEPGLENFTVVTDPIIESAIDENGQHLDVVMNEDPNANVNPLVYRRNYIPNQSNQDRQIVVRFKSGEKESTVFKKLAGKLTAQMLTKAKPMVVINNVLKAANTTGKAKDGTALTVMSVNQEAANRYSVQVRVEGRNNPFGNANIFINGNVIIRGNVIINNRRVSSSNSNTMPALLDKTGKAYRHVSTPRSSMRSNNGQISREMTLVFQANPGQGAPDRMVLTGQELETIQVPFRFENVTLR